MGNDVAVELVCFDLGRVLLQLAGSWADACRLAGVDYGGEISPEAREVISRCVDRNERGGSDIGEFSAGVGECVGLGPGEVQRVHEAWLREPYPGVEELIGRLIAAGVQTACLSNTNAYHWQFFIRPGHRAYLGLERLHHRFASHLVGCRKPEPEIYAHVEEVTGLPGQAIVFFDDLAENVAAASDRGWQAHQIHPEPDPVTQMTEHLRRLGVLD